MKSTRDNMKKLVRLRLREARLLLQAKQFAGAYYLCGLCIECALKACIAKRTKRYDFPDKKVVDNSWSHDLSRLLATAELGKELVQEGQKGGNFEKHWNAVQA